MMFGDAEQITDGMITYLKKNLVARQALTEEAAQGTNVIKIDNTIHFNDVEEVAFAIDGDNHVEFHTILKVVDRNTIILLNSLNRAMGPSNGALIQKAIGNTALFDDKILFGDRDVIPIESGIAITVEPSTLTNEWIALPGILSEEYSLVIMVYAKGDSFENAKRISMKYAKAIYYLLNTKVHMDIVNDEVPISTSLSAGDTTITIPTTDGWGVDSKYRYEVQSSSHVEIDFKIEEVLSPTELRINRPLYHSHDVNDKLKFIRRVVYMYDSRVNNVEYGTVSKSNTLLKAARLSWFGKETEDYIFPQHSKS